MPDPFELFELPRRYDVDLQALQQRYVQAAAANHPDRFIDPMEQADAAALTAEINEAYRILRDPEKRADLLLRLLGGAAKEDDKSLPPDLLMEIMEAREELDEAVEAGDQETIDRLHAWAREQREQTLQTVASLFAAGPEADLELIRLHLNTLPYYQRMIEAV